MFSRECHCGSSCFSDGDHREESVFLDYCIELSTFLTFDRAFPYLISLRIEYFGSGNQVSTDLAMNFRNLREIALSSSTYRIELDSSVFLICTKLEKIHLDNFYLDKPQWLSHVRNLTNFSIQRCNVNDTTLLMLPLSLRELQVDARSCGWRVEYGEAISRLRYLEVLSWRMKPFNEIIVRTTHCCCCWTSE